MAPKTKARLNSALKFLLAAGIVAWLVSTGKFDVRSSLALFRSPLFFVGFLFIGLNLFLTSERWRSLAVSQNVRAGAGSVFRLTLIGTFFNYAMPGGVGGDLVKAYYFGKDHPDARAAAITSVFLDRVLGLYAMIVMAAAVMLLDSALVFSNPTLTALFALLVALGFGFSLALLLMFSRRFKRTGLLEAALAKLPFSGKFLKLYETAHGFGLLRGKVIRAIVISLIAQSVTICFLWTAGMAAGFADVPLGLYFLVAPLGYMATAIPISPAGIGVGQAAFFGLFNLYLGHESGVGPAVITAQQAMTALFGLVGALLYIRRGEPAPEALPGDEAV